VGGRAQFFHQRPRAAVAAQHRRVKAADARGPCPLAERHQELGADAAVLPGVDHLDRDFRRFEVVEAHVAGDSDRRPRWWRKGDHRLVMPMVDAHEAAQLARGKFILRAEVALIAGLRAQAAERERERSAVRRKEFADHDRPHLSRPLTRFTLRT